MSQKEVQELIESEVKRYMQPASEKPKAGTLSEQRQDSIGMPKQHDKTIDGLPLHSDWVVARMKITPPNGNEFVDTFVALNTYYSCRKTITFLNPDMLIKLLTEYFRALLFRPANANKQYYVTVSDGRLLLIQMRGRNEKGDNLPITLSEVSTSLLTDVCTDFVKSATPGHYEALINLFNRVLLTPELSKIHRYDIFNAENLILKDRLPNTIRSMPYDEAVQTLLTRKTLVTQEIQNYQQGIITDAQNIDALQALHNQYTVDVIDLLIAKNQFENIFQFLCHELRGCHDPKIAAFDLNSLILYNNLFVIKKPEIVRALVDQNKDLIDQEQYKQMISRINFSLNDLELRDYAIEPVESDKTNFEFRGVELSHIKTIVSFVVPYKASKEYSTLEYDGRYNIEFKSVNNLFDDPIFQFLHDLNQNLNGMPITFISDAMGNVGNCTLIVIMMKEFYHPDFDLLDHRIKYINHEEKEAMLGRKYYPHKEKIVEILRKIYDERRRDLPIDVSKDALNINLLSNYLINYVDDNNVSIFHKLYALTNPDSYLRIRERYREKISDLK